MRVIISVFRQPSASGFDSAIKLPGRARFVRGGHGIGSGLSSLSGGDDAGTGNELEIMYTVKMK